MSLLNTLYPHPDSAHRQHSGPQPVTVVVCLPPGAHRDLVALVAEIAPRLRPYVAVPAGMLRGNHFMLWHPVDATESALLVLASPPPDLPGRTYCAGGPIGLLDLAANSARLREFAADHLSVWQRTVSGTPAARPWASFFDAHHSDPQGYPLPRAVAEFAAQPRIAAMADHDRRADAAERFSGDMYGPALEAMQAGLDAFADYLAGMFVFADGLVDLHGHLMVPSFTATLVEQTHTERAAFHDRARRYVAGLDPTTVLVAVTSAW